MSYSPITGTGSGSAPVVNLVWPWLDKANVKARVSGVDVALTWTGPAQVTFSAVVANGAAYEVYRDTAILAPATDFTDNSVLTATDLDRANLQHLYFAQEIAVELASQATDIATLGVAIGLPVGLFTAASAHAISSTVERLYTSGYSTRGKGSAFYTRDAAVDAAYVAANPRTSFLPALAATGFRLATDQPLFATMFGAAGDGATDDTAAVAAAFALLASGGKLFFNPGLAFKVTTLNLTGSGVHIVAWAATITSATTASAGVLSLTGSRNKVQGGTWLLTAGSDVPWFFEITGTYNELDGVRTLKTPDAGGYQMYVRSTALGFVARNSRFEGSNGIYWEAGSSAFLANVIIGRASGGDDGIAIKGLTASVRNVRIIGNHFENLSSGVSVGSEVGVAGANDATYSRTVGQIDFVGNTLINCGSIAFIKPGGVASVDVRDGTVEVMVISNNTLIDETGLKFFRGIAITPGRGGRVRQISGRNNVIRARSAGGAGRLVGALDIYILDYAGGTAEADVSGVDVQVDYADTWNGVANGVGGAPGFPVTNNAAVLRAGAVGTASDIVLDVRGSGSSEAGLVVGPSLMDSVRINRLKLRQVNVTNAAGQGGMYFESRVQAAGAYVDVVPAAGPVLTVVGAGSLVTATTALTGDVTGTASESSGVTSISATIANGSVTLAKMANMATASVIYRKAVGSGPPEVQTLATLKADLGLTGTNSGDQTITLTGDVTGSGTGSFAATIAAGVVSLAKMANLAANSFILNNTGAPATPIAGTAAQAKALLAIANTDVSGLGTASTANTGTSGHVLAFLDGANTFSAVQTFSATPVFSSGKITVTSAGLGQIDIRDSTNGGGLIKFRNAADSASLALMAITAAGGSLGTQCDTIAFSDLAAANNFMTLTAASVAIKAANATVANVTASGVAVTGLVSATTSIKSSGAGGVGYATGAGGAVTQATSKSTGVTINKDSGQITLNAAALAAAGVVTFTVTNSEVAATDTINLNLASGQATVATYRYWIEKVAAGSFQVTLENRSAGSLSEALVFNFAIIKAVNA